MLTVKSINKTDRLIEWHVGESTESLKVLADKNAIDFMQADGDEREFIQDFFGVHVRTGRMSVVRWYGEDARFIAGNL